MNDKLQDLLKINLPVFQAGKLNCAEAVLLTMCEYYHIELRDCPKIATALGGGLSGTQSLCGAVSGALMVIGLKHGRLMGGDKAPAYDFGKRFMAWYKENEFSLNCSELTGMDLTDPDQMAAFRADGGKHETLCQRLVADSCHWLTENL